MDIPLMVRWVDSVKTKYGNNVEDVMEAHYLEHRIHSEKVAMNTMAFGLTVDRAPFIYEFQQAGGDYTYLLKIKDAFLKVRTKYHGL